MYRMAVLAAATLFARGGHLLHREAGVTGR